MKTTTVAEQLNRNPLTGEIFRAYGIDYCCQGDLPVKTAAKEALANVVSLEKELNRIATLSDSEINISKWEVDAVIGHIVTKHHDFIRENIPVIVYYASRVVHRNSEAFPELIQVQRLIGKAVKQLEKHLKTEEEILFPYFRQMLVAKQEGRKIEPSAIAPLANLIKQTKQENRETAYLFKRISKLTNNYMLPADVRNPFRVLYQQLDAFEKDLILHLHLQNNVLFPKAQILEQEVIFLGEA